MDSVRVHNGAPPPSRDRLLFASQLDVNSCLELGYAYHVANRGSEDEGDKNLCRRVARQQMDAFMALRAPHDTNDAIYLFKVRPIIISLGRGISRRKEDYLRDMGAAEKYRATELERYNMARNDVFWKHVSMRALISGGIGFFLMRTVLAFVEIKVSENSQTAIDNAGIGPSMLAALVFVGITKVVTQKMDDFKLSNIYAHYEWLRHQAQLNYAKAKLAEYRHAEERLRRVWREYTGRTAPKVVTFASVLEEDIRMLEAWVHEREQFTRSLLKHLQVKVTQLRAALKRKKKIEKDAEVAAAAPTPIPATAAASKQP